MFTIKQVAHHTGDESFWEAENVRICSRNEGPKLYDDRIVRFDIPQRDGAILCGSIDTGTVYIMNSAGKTVDRYLLHSSQMDYEGNLSFSQKAALRPRSLQFFGLTRKNHGSDSYIFHSLNSENFSGIKQGEVEYYHGRDYTIDFEKKQIVWTPILAHTGDTIQAEPAPETEYQVYYYA